MPSFDESTLRKAASWQDFKEAQALLKAGLVISSESASDGWRGSVRVGKRTFRTTVSARTPTWFDAKCPCPANQREGTFCSHAIATGLHLLAPPTAPEPTPEPRATPPPSTRPELPEIAWSIHFQGTWDRALKKGRASLRLTTGEHTPTIADKRITEWLVSQKQTSQTTLQLALDSRTLPGFLSSARNHLDLSSADGAVSIETGIQLRIADCELTGDKIHFKPAASELVKIGSSFWQICAHSLSRIGATNPGHIISRVLSDLSTGKSTSVSKQEFLNQLEDFQAYIDFSASEWFESLQFISASPQFSLEVTGSESGLKARFSTSYSQPLPDLNNQRILSQNFKAEAEAKSWLANIFDPLSDSSFELTDPEKIRDFLTRKLPQIPSDWDVELAPGLKKLASSYVFISPKIEILSSSPDTTEFQLQFQTDSGKLLDTSEVRRLLRSRGSGNSKITFSEEIEGLIDPLFEDLELHQENGRFIAKQASAGIIKELSERLGKTGTSRPTMGSSRLIHKAPIRGNLRPYQIQGFSWLVDRLSKYGGALLADDMGLGKTIQTIACIEHFFSTYSQPSPVLIVVTTSLLGNWKSEFERFAPNRRVITLHGPKRDRLRDKVKSTDVILTTYSTLSRDLAWHLRQPYSIAVIDEASLIRNPDTDHSKAVAKLNAERRIALTGTPVENSARDLWSIFRFIQPGWLGTKQRFKERYEAPLKSTETHQQTSNLLRLKTSPFTLRRTKSEVAPELPSKILIDERCVLSKDQLSVYRDIQKEGLRRLDETRASGQDAAARMQTLTTLLRLRQACCDLALLDSDKLRSLPIPRRSAKLERLLEITEQSIESGSRLLVFSQFQKQLVEIENALEAKGISSLRLDGQTRNRQEMVDRFQSSDGPPVFLISLKAGGYGLNLTAADVVVHFDPWWNPAAEAQATDRAHRIGQTKPVTVFRLLTQNTVEEKVTELQSKKKALAESLDEASTPIDAPGWSASEMEALLMD
jgi:SNF2 family DNA or RNA helicase